MKRRKIFYPLKASDPNFVICKNVQMTKSQIFKISPSKCLVASVRLQLKLSTKDDILQGICVREGEILLVSLVSQELD